MTNWSEKQAAYFFAAGAFFSAEVLPASFDLLHSVFALQHSDLLPSAAKPATEKAANASVVRKILVFINVEFFGS
jgi:hypothetical protein